MYSNSSAGNGNKPRAKRKSFSKRKVCRFCTDRDYALDYKHPKTLSFFITERGKVIPRRITGNCALHQRRLTVEIKRARILALLPFTATHANFE